MAWPVSCDEDTSSVLYAFRPKSDVLPAVLPLENTKTFLAVLVEEASELAAVTPSKKAFSLNTIAHPLPIVLVFVGPNKRALAVHLAINDVSDIHAAIWPFEDPLTVFLFAAYEHGWFVDLRTFEFVSVILHFFLLEDVLLAEDLVIYPVARVTLSVSIEHRTLSLS